MSDIYRLYTWDHVVVMFLCFYRFNSCVSSQLCLNLYLMKSNVPFLCPHKTVYSFEHWIVHLTRWLKMQELSPASLWVEDLTGGNIWGCSRNFRSWVLAEVHRSLQGALGEGTLNSDNFLSISLVLFRKQRRTPLPHILTTMRFCRSAWSQVRLETTI